MAKDTWDSVWERVRAGRHTMVIGPALLPPGPSDVQVLHVNCAAPGPGGGLLEAALRDVARCLGEDIQLPAPGRCSDPPLKRSW